MTDQTNRQVHISQRLPVKAGGIRPGIWKMKKMLRMHIRKKLTEIYGEENFIV